MAKLHLVMDKGFYSKKNVDELLAARIRRCKKGNRYFFTLGGTTATIVKAMEDNRDNLIVILAGYCWEMDCFMQSNPGLRSRFPIQIDFPDYDNEELFRIALQMVQERDYEMSNKCRWKLKCILDEFVKKHHPHSGNARYVRNMVEKSIRLQALRLVDREYLTRKDLMMIEDIDLP